MKKGASEVSGVEDEKLIIRKLLFFCHSFRRTTDRSRSVTLCLAFD